MASDKFTTAVGRHYISSATLMILHRRELREHQTHQQRGKDKMFTQRHIHLEKVFLSALAVLHLIVVGKSTVAADLLETTTTPALSNSTLMAQVGAGGMEEPKMLHTFRSCTNEHAHYCSNGGQCIYPQDTDKPACICTSSFKGERCLFISDHTRTLPELEELIAISIGVAMFIFALAILIYCIFWKRCVKSAQLIKSAPSDSTV